MCTRYCLLDWWVSRFTSRSNPASKLTVQHFVLQLTSLYQVSTVFDRTLSSVTFDAVDGKFRWKVPGGPDHQTKPDRNIIDPPNLAEMRRRIDGIVARRVKPPS
jgi:hypothetical protein